MKEILIKYPQTIMFNGHIHDGVGAIEVKQTEFGTMVDAPGMKDNDYGIANDSTGNKGADKASQYIDFGENLKLGKDDFTMMFCYKAASGTKESGTVLTNRPSDAEDSGVSIGGTGEKKDSV